MAETPFPNPLTSQFNASAWATDISPQERDFLDSNFVTFPTAQPGVIFSVSPTVPTLPIATSDTRAASASFVQSAKGTNVWGALQTFNAGMVTNAINPTTAGGTLLIGNASASNNVEVASVASRSAILHLGDGNNSTGGVHIGDGTSSSNNVRILSGTGSTGTIFLGSATSTTSLGVPLTPAYTYPIAAGKIGQIINYSGSTTPITFTTDTPLQLMSMTGFAPGTWIMTASVLRGASSNLVYLTIALSTTTADVTSVNAEAIEYAVGTSSGTGITNTLTAIIQSTSSSTVYYVNGQTNTGGTGTTMTPVVWRSVRIA